MPTLLHNMDALPDAEEKAARGAVTSWVNMKSNQLLQFFDKNKDARVPRMDVPLAPTFREMLEDFQCEVNQRKNPSKLLPKKGTWSYIIWVYSLTALNTITILLKIYCWVIKAHSDQCYLNCPPSNCGLGYGLS